MTKELSQRIITSILLFVIAIFLCIYANQVFFLLALIIVFFISYQEWIKLNSNKFKFEGLLYLIFFVSCAFLLRGHELESYIFFTFILCICICSDIGGYICGKTIGGLKLTKISPNKTISGSIGSFVFSLVPVFIFDTSVNPYHNLSIYSELSFKIIIFCLCVSLACQVGDLIISYFKRKNKVKDTGRILPGHGGLLDRIDRIIFAIPSVYILIILGIF